MKLTEEQKRALLRPGTLWKRKRNGAWERVYLESTKSRLLKDGLREVDFRTPFGLEHIPRAKFLQTFEFIGWAEVRLEELAHDKNLIPTIQDPKLWKDIQK